MEQWEKAINSSGTLNEVFNLVSINKLGNIVVTYYVAPPPPPGFNSNGDRYYIREYNPTNGNIITIYNNQYNDVTGFPNAIVLDSLNSMYVTSTTSDSLIMYIAKFTHSYNTYNDKTWDNEFNYTTGSGEAIRGIDMKIDANLNVYVLSYISGGLHEFYTIKINSGSTVWTSRYNGSLNSDNFPVSIFLNKLNPPEIFETGSSKSYNGTFNFITIKYNNNGDTTWTIAYDCGNNGNDIANAMVKDIKDNLYITGYSNCNNTNRDIKTIKICNQPPHLSLVLLLEIKVYAVVLQIHTALQK